MSSTKASRGPTRAAAPAAHTLLHRNLDSLALIAALWLALVAAVAAAAQADARDAFAGLGTVYCSLDAATLGREIDSREILLPRDVDAHLRFVPHPETGTITNVRWEGLEGTPLAVDGDTAILPIRNAGRHTLRVRLEIGSGAQRQIVSRRLTLRAADVAAAEVRASIVYPGAGAQSPVDVDGNLTIDGRDHDAFLTSYGARRGQPAYRAIADWNGDNTVDAIDLAAFTAAYDSWHGRDLGGDAHDGAVLQATSNDPAALFPAPLPLARALSEPAGFEGWIEWTLDGAPHGLGAVSSAGIRAIGERRLGARLFGAEQDSRSLTIYRVSIYDPDRQRLLDPVRDLLREGVAYGLEAVTEPAGFEDLVTWRAWTEHGTVSPEAGQGPRFDVVFANTFGAENRHQKLIVQAGDMVMVQQVVGQGRFPAALALGLFDALQKLADLTSAEVDQPQGGRRVLEHVVGEFLPVYYQVLDFEIEAKGLQVFKPFRDKSEIEIQTEAARLLTTMTDAQLNKLVFVDSELRMLPADMAIDAGLPARIAAETDADGFLVSDSWVLEWLWNKSQSLLGCFAKGIAGLIVKLIGALHGAIHDGALAGNPTLVPVQKTATVAKSQADALAILDELGNVADLVVSGRNAPDGARRVIKRVRTRTLPLVDATLRAKLEILGKDAMTPFLDRGILEVNKTLDVLLTRPNAELNRRLFSDVALIAASEALLEAETGIRQMILDTVPATPATGKAGGASAGDGFDVVEWLWETAVGLIGCIPDIGALLEKLVGTVHDVAHAPKPAPTGPEVVAFQALTAIVNQVNALEANPQRGRQLALFVRDETLPAVQQVLDAKFIDMGEAHLTELVELGIDGQQNRMTALLERSDDELNVGLYDSETSVLAYSETFTAVFGTDPETSGTVSLASAANVWNSLVRFLKCLSEGKGGNASAAATATPGAAGDDDDSGDKLMWVIEELHDFLH